MDVRPWMEAVMETAMVRSAWRAKTAQMQLVMVRLVGASLRIEGCLGVVSESFRGWRIRFGSVPWSRCWQALAVARGLEFQVPTMCSVVSWTRHQVQMADCNRRPIPTPNRPQALKLMP